MKLFYNKKIFLLKVLAVLLVLASIFICALCLWYSSRTSNQVVINEVCSSNFNLIPDENGLYSDYIELYNPGVEPVALGNYFLSDDAGQLQKYPLGEVVLPPKGYEVIWLDGIGDGAAGSREFRVSSLGEEIFLSDAGSDVLIDSVAVPKLSYNTSYGRVTDGGAKWSRMTATAGRSNNDTEFLPVEELSEPVFSVPSGFYEEAFPLTITAEENEIIYYTLDGSDPTPDKAKYDADKPLEIDDATGQENLYAARTDLSPTRAYVPAFPVDKATVVRAISYNPQENTVSKPVTKVYFVGYGQREEYNDLPVISLVTDPANLFDGERGIYGNGRELERYQADGGWQDGELLGQFTDAAGNERYLYMASNAFNEGKEWERGASLTYFDDNHEYCFTQNTGIRIAGDSSRGTPHKSFSIYGRDIYDTNVIFPYIFFPATEYSTLKLRNGGSENDALVFTDAFLEEQAIGRDVSIQRSTPCVVFLNGEYWGIYNIRERYREEYFNSHYGYNESQVWFVDRKSAQIGGDAAQEAYQYMIDLITVCDLSFDDVYAMVGELIDVQSLLDYLCINLYLDNRDIDFGQNTALWRTAEADGTEYGDGRWRWMLYDLDVTAHGDSNRLPLTWMRDYPLLNEPVIKSLMASAQFRRQFCITFMDIANTVYSYPAMHEELKKWQAVYEVQVTKNHRRFFDGNFTQDDFAGYVEEKDSFFRERFPFAMVSLAGEFGLTGSLETVLVRNSDPEAGTVTVNTATVDESGEFTGTYFTDFPLTLTATAKEGYRFVGWRGDVAGTESRMEVSIPAGGVAVTAVFEKIEG